MPALALDDDLGFWQRVEDLTIEQFVIQAGVEALDINTPSPIDRAGCPTVAGQRRNLHAVDDSALEGWIEVAHRLSIKVDDATGFERPDIVYFNDRSLMGDFNEGVSGLVVFAMTNAAKRLAQISMDRSGPRDRIV